MTKRNEHPCQFGSKHRAIIDNRRKVLEGLPSTNSHVAKGVEQNFDANGPACRDSRDGVGHRSWGLLSGHPCGWHDTRRSRFSLSSSKPNSAPKCLSTTCAMGANKVLGICIRLNCFKAPIVITPKNA
jgi:hypothetical protein